MRLCFPGILAVPDWLWHKTKAVFYRLMHLCFIFV